MRHRHPREIGIPVGCLRRLSVLRQRSSQGHPTPPKLIMRFCELCERMEHFRKLSLTVFRNTFGPPAAAVVIYNISSSSKVKYICCVISKSRVLVAVHWCDCSSTPTHYCCRIILRTEFVLLHITTALLRCMCMHSVNRCRSYSDYCCCCCRNSKQSYTWGVTLSPILCTAVHTVPGTLVFVR